jgi:archaellum component FlaG (FlaF/FlaG flagellin family)
MTEIVTVLPPVLVAAAIAAAAADVVRRLVRSGKSAPGD